MQYDECSVEPEKTMIFKGRIKGCFKQAGSNVTHLIQENTPVSIKLMPNEILISVEAQSQDGTGSSS